jgi:site-specific DNA-cytosine methylase
MKILIACEFSGIVREAFRRRGHDAYSCDLLPSERKGQHYQCDVREVFRHGWDMLIAHPPCTDLAVSGSRWFSKKRKEQIAAFEFVMLLALAEIEKICIEQPVSVVSSRWRKPDQVIQPWMFGHPENKKTCLWLKGLPPLEPTKIVRWKMNRRPIHLANRVHHARPGPERWKERSRTFPGIAAAMAEQWGNL